jgi:hypothetical protein
MADVKLGSKVNGMPGFAQREYVEFLIVDTLIYITVFSDHANTQ